MNRTFHASVRAQQRGIPPLIDRWLDEYGEEEYDGHGCVKHFFSANSIRRMERDVGRAILRKLSEFMNCYKVVSARNGTTVTIGHRLKHIKRK